MRMTRKIASVFKRLILKAYYGKYYCTDYLAAEKNVTKKIQNIDQLYTKKQRKKLFFEGFNSDKYIWYNFDKFDKKDYISDFEHFSIMRQIDWHQYYIANDKLVTERMMQPFCKVLTSVGYIFENYYYPIGEHGLTLDELIDDIMNGGEFYCKPNGGGSGHGIGRLWKKNDKIHWNNNPVDDVKRFICSLTSEGTRYLVQRRFMQKGFSNEVNPDTLNTIRFVTMVSPSTHEPFLACSFHRFGRKGAFVDNVAKENIFCPIDINTGIIEKVITPPVNGKIEFHDKHPDTGVQLKGVKIPHWEEMVEHVLSLSKQLPFMPLCGWDIILSDGEFVMQELNFNPDTYLGQMIYPLLKDQRVKEFINYYRKK